MLKKYKNLLQEKEYLKLVVANIITRLGDGIDMIAFSWLVYEISGSTVLMATIMGVNMIPNLLFGLVSGIACQYIKEKTIMWICDFGRGICVLIIGLLYFSGNLQVWHLFVIMFLNSTFESFRQPASSAIFPLIIRQENMEEGIALKESTNALANLVGVGLGPLCIGLFGFSGALFIDAFSFMLCGCITMLLKVKYSVKKAATNSMAAYVKDFKEGLTYIKKDGLLLRVISYGCIINMMFVPINIFMTPYIKDYCLMGTEGVSLLSLTVVFGTIICSPLGPIVKEKLKGLNMMVIFGILSSIMICGLKWLPLLPKPTIYFGLGIMGVIVGGCISLLNFPFHVAVYKRVDQEHLSYTNAVMGMISQAATPLGSFIFGAISGFVPLTTIYIGCGVAGVLFFAMMYFNSHVKELNEV